MPRVSCSQEGRPRRELGWLWQRRWRRLRGGGGGYGGGGYSDSPREMFTTTCDSCGKEARVPFRPTGSKPVYCSDCFRR